MLICAAHLGSIIPTCAIMSTCEASEVTNSNGHGKKPSPITVDPISLKKQRSAAAGGKMRDFVINGHNGSTESESPKTPKTPRTSTTPGKPTLCILFICIFHD